MITPTVIILLVLLFRDGTSHPVKATSGSLVVSGCGCRYGNSAQCFAALHFPSLHAEAVPHGGIFNLVDTRCILRFSSVFFRCPVILPFPLVFRGTPSPTVYPVRCTRPLYAVFRKYTGSSCISQIPEQLDFSPLHLSTVPFQ